MIVLVLTAIGVATALLTPRRLKRLAQLELHHLWLVWLAIIAQTLLFEVLAEHLSLAVSNVIHLGTYALCLVFLWSNRRIAGMWIIAVGTAGNLAAIAANGGTMPADPDAWRAAGLPEFNPEVFENSRELASPRLLFLRKATRHPHGGHSAAAPAPRARRRDTPPGYDHRGPSVG